MGVGDPAFVRVKTLPTGPLTAISEGAEGARRTAIARFRVDTWAAEAVAALRVAGISALLLKGPAISRWLYPGNVASRPYLDVDLLVSPADYAGAETVLASLGYEGQGPAFIEGDLPHARPFVRDSDGAMVDLHRVLHGMENV